MSKIFEEPGISASNEYRELYDSHCDLEAKLKIAVEALNNIKDCSMGESSEVCAAEALFKINQASEAVTPDKG